MILPGLRRGSDATAIGTGVHSAIEHYLLGKCSTLVEMTMIAEEQVKMELEGDDIRKTEISDNMDDVIASVRAMITAWWDDIRPSVTLGGLVEHKFKAPLNVNANGIELWLEGTMDYVAPDGVIWDWKTAGRTYYAKEKQKQSHQATCYIAAARTLGLVDNGDDPTMFRFGVMVRQKTPKAQIVTVSRNKEQVEWLRRQIQSVAYSALTLPTNVDWAMNDQHNLCSEKWCDYWTVCKGVHWDECTMEPPSQNVELRSTAP
jgi:hypothetical protein